ncbi:unnamed protein product [Mytilus coruscus]|uniref:Uncharacterized protein n=1 Tax=Mytilus coruscus TaxID=42192 RepID=A0A6J8CUB9_MYTCO|nr:unnamed protein product [Mytilus coruscus]
MNLVVEWVVVVRVRVASGVSGISVGSSSTGVVSSDGCTQIDSSFSGFTGISSDCSLLHSSLLEPRELYRMDSGMSGNNADGADRSVIEEFDIIKHEDFNKSNQVFKTTITELKANGKGATQHFPIISEIDRAKLYSSAFMQPISPTGLLNKVKFDIRMYFFRRGAENMDKMTKDTFIVKTDPKTKTKYETKKIDELTKNHRFNDKKNVTALIPEQPESPSYPVVAFQKYISKLHPPCNRLWQRPLGSFYQDSATWYCNSPVGRDTLA